MKFFERIEMEIKQSEYTQKEIAKMLHIAESNISNWKKGENLPSVDILCKLCSILDVSADYLLGLTDYGETFAASPTAPALEKDERQLLALFGKMSHTQKIRAIAYCEGLLSTAQSSAEKNYRA